MTTLNIIEEALSFNFAPIFLRKNSKIPLLKQWNVLFDPTKYLEYSIKFPYNNIGILTGIFSNIIIIDIDIRNGGLEEWNLLLKKNNKKINTPLVQTASGGFHYYFKYNEEYEKYKFFLYDPEEKRKINGIDILKTGKQAVYPESIINDKVYKWIISPKDCNIKKVPKWLFQYFLLK